MPDRRSVLLSLAATLVGLGSAVLIYQRSAREDISLWVDPFFWVGAVGLAAGATLYVWLLIPPWLSDWRTRRAREELLEQEGHANQRQGLGEISSELDAIFQQLQAELRLGKRGAVFPSNAWTKNRHLLSGEIQAYVEYAHERTRLLDKGTLAATRQELTEAEAAERRDVKRIVDDAARAVRSARN